MPKKIREFIFMVFNQTTKTKRFMNIFSKNLNKKNTKPNDKNPQNYLNYLNTQK